MRKGAISKQAQAESAPAPAKPLSAQHARFAVEYSRDRNATKAYGRVYPNASEGAAAVGGSRLLKNAQIREAIAATESQILIQAIAESGITLERTLREIGRLAFFDVRQLLNADGSCKPLTDLDEEAAASIAGLDLQSIDLGQGEKSIAAVVRKYKISDKRAALDMLMRHLGGYKEDNKQQGGLAELLAQVKRSALPIVSTLPPEGDAE